MNTEAKKVVLKSIHIENWRGAKDTRLDFGERETNIGGANGTGKSTIFDGFLWCLFGKDQQGRTDFTIKTYKEGEPLQKIDASVEVTLDDGGIPITFKRVLHEKWQKPRGQVDEVFRGNETICFINDVPTSVGDYKMKVSAVVEESQFKLLTNPDFFLNLDWKTQRETLFEIAGTKTDEEIARGNRSFEALLEMITHKGLDGYRKEIAAKKKRSREALQAIQPRIDQTEKLKPEEQDWAAIEADIKGIESEIQTLRDGLADNSKLLKIHLEECRKIENTLMANRADRDRMAWGRFRERNDENAQKEKAYQTLKMQADTLRAELHDQTPRLQRLIDNHNQEIAKVDGAINALREQWREENAKEYNGSDICSACGQTLPQEMMAEALEHFNRHKRETLTAIENRARAATRQKEELRKEVSEYAIKLERARADAKEREAKLEELERKLQALPTAKQVTMEEVTMELQKETAYQTLVQEEMMLRNRLDELRKKPQETNEDKQIKDKIREKEARKDFLIKELAKRETIARHEEQIRELEEEGRTLGQEIADLERTEGVMQDFTRAKIEDAERRINSLFSRVTFQLFSYTQEGNEQEVCIPLVDGVPYSVSNTASQVNAGLDVINTLGRHYGVFAPIFIDNRERVTSIIDTPAQVINLRVTDDPRLCIK